MPFLVYEGEGGWESDEAEHIVYIRGWVWRPGHDGGRWVGWDDRCSPSIGGIPHISAKDEYRTEEPTYWRWNDSDTPEKG